MKIGFVGIGNLGLPCAVAIAMKGHEVMAYDIVADLMTKNLGAIARPVQTARNPLTRIWSAVTYASAAWKKWLSMQTHSLSPCRPHTSQNTRE